MARIGDDEAVARKAQDGTATYTWPLWTVSKALCHGHELGPRGSVEASPARVLAECEAKRRIVAMAVDAAEAGVNAAAAVGGWSDAARARVERAGYAQAVVSLRQVLEHLALPFASHPDYDERWRP